MCEGEPSGFPFAFNKRHFSVYRQMHRLRRPNSQKHNVTGLPTQWGNEYRPGRYELAARTVGH